jgi:uncharacterized protein YbbK (DUF523 family)
LRRQTASDCDAFTPKQFRRPSCRSAHNFAAPRESLRLAEVGKEIRLIINKTAQDQTSSMRGYARRRLEELADAQEAGRNAKADAFAVHR